MSYASSPHVLRHMPDGRAVLVGEQQMYRALDQLPVPAYACDAAGLITYYNAEAVELWGRAPRLNDMAERYCGSYRLYQPDGAPLPHEHCWMARALSEQREFRGMEVVIERNDGSRRTALAHARPYRGPAGQVRGAVNVMVDISERKQTEAVLRRADRHKNEFLAMLSHELRNPLASIRNGLHILRLSGAGGSTPEAETACDTMERQLAHTVRLIDDLLDLTRITRGKIELRRERVDLTDVVGDAVEASRGPLEAAGHRFELVPPPHPLFVDGDRTRLAQVVGNLLINSAKYTPPGGCITLTVDCQGGQAVITVRDDGIGIEPDVLPQIFELYMQGEQLPQSSQRGLGIGLSLVRGLVSLHGGHVHAHSDGRGKGSQFSVQLPVASPVADDGPDDGSGTGSGGLSKYRILVVDDNQDAAISLAVMLKLMGHESSTAHDGLEAVSLTASTAPQVVLLDLGLPGINGYEACRRIRALPDGGRPVLIALTGWGQEDDKRRSKEAGFDFHLVKPVDPDALEKLLAGLALPPG
ncbi:hybrid sensor histidine kinase/response regulator [Caldimonas brevitalea]|uniref:histidine kinase n=1 Tax=Caldimonas brevitalea TaxID=413882 RepID=A0A0G3BFI3_9BURK|nr:ATP-binding protein [Caldimonas brevitalea]AKJ26728.1 chemotaxis protein methyltransferase CheR [Caldimonas brevitalea]